MKGQIDGLIKQKMGITTIIAVLITITLAITAFTYPEMVSIVASLCLSPFCVLFGWVIGLMDAKRNAKL